METILASDAEKYARLILEQRLKSNEVATLKNMLANPDTIKFISFNFSDNYNATRGGCWGAQSEIEDPIERTEALNFFLKFTEKQLDGITQEIKSLHYTENSMRGN